MTDNIALIVVAIISLLGTMSGSYFAQRKTTVLISYRIEQLEEKVHKHNNLIERTYAIEKNCGVCEEKIKVINNRIKDLEE